MMVSKDSFKGFCYLLLVRSIHESWSVKQESLSNWSKCDYAGNEMGLY